MNLPCPLRHPVLRSALYLLSIRVENNRGELKAISHHHAGRCAGCPCSDPVLNELLDHNLPDPLQYGLYTSVGYVGLSHPLQTAAPPSSLAADPLFHFSLKPAPWLRFHGRWPALGRQSSRRGGPPGLLREDHQMGCESFHILMTCL